MLTWQRPCFRKEGPQIHNCIKPTEKREERSPAAGARWWTGFGASSSNQVGPTTLPTTHTLPALQNRLNYRFHLLWNARRPTLSTLSSACLTFFYEVINDSSEVFAKSRSFDCFYIGTVKRNEKTDPMMLIGNVIHLPYHQTCLKRQVETGKKERNILWH